MSSILKVDKIQGSTGSTIEIPAGQTLVNNGSASGFASGIVGVSTFTASGTWTKATREATLGVTIKRVIVEVQGGGGGGGGSSSGSYGAGGGAGGGYARKLIDVSAISSSTITVGAAGSGGTGSNDGVGGGNSSWSDGTNTVTGSGGVGGSGNSGSTYTNGGAGGTASGGDINITGGNGGRVYMAKIGGCSPFSNGAVVRVGDTSNADGYGGGGTGSRAAIISGGNGSPGIVIVWEIAG